MSSPKLHERLRGERGQALIFFAVSIVVLFAFVSLGIDLGLFRDRQRRMQTAADAGAIAGASQLPYPPPNGGSSGATTAARRDTTLNGYTDGNAGTQVAIRIPPTSGPNAGNGGYVEVVVSQPQDAFFARALGVTSVDVAARAVAGALDSKTCIYVLNPTASGSLHTEQGGNNGSPTLSSTCAIFVNSNSGSATTASGLIDAPAVGMVGNCSGCGNIRNVSTGAPARLPDPLALLPAPAVGACTTTNYNINMGSATLNPGVYCAGMSICGTANVTLNPGVYILAGGGTSGVCNGGGGNGNGNGNGNNQGGASLSVNGTARLTGSGVMFYLTQKAGFPYAPVDIQTGAVVTLSAATTGPYAGILFFQDRGIPAGQPASTFGGTGGGFLTGAMYFPTTELDFSNGVWQSGPYMMIVADKLRVEINSLIVTDNYSSLPNGSPIKSARLTE